MSTTLLPAIVDVTIPQGADWQLVIRYEAGDPLEPVDLTGWSARAQFRTAYDGELVFDLTSEDDGGITLNNEGEIVLTLTNAQTAEAEAGRGVWDIELVSPSGQVMRLAQGRMVITPEVTREEP